MFYNESFSCFEKLRLTKSERLFAGILYTTLTTISLLLNCLVICVILEERKTTLKLVVYKMVISLCASSIVYVCCNYIVMLPCTFRECINYSDTLMVTVSAFNTVGYYTSSWTSLYIAFERITLFVLPQMHRTIEKILPIFVSLPWMIGLVITASTMAIGCYKR